MYFPSEEALLMFCRLEAKKAESLFSTAVRFANFNMFSSTCRLDDKSKIFFFESSVLFQVDMKDLQFRSPESGKVDVIFAMT